MKTLNKLIYILLIVVVATSCLKDEGNYDYVNLPEVDLSQISKEANGIIGERLLIQGDIVTTLSDNDLSFSWAIRKQDENYDWYMDTLSTEKDLDILINMVPGENDLFYSVWDIKQGVRYERHINLLVNTPFSTGWAMLKEKNGLAEFDFISLITDTHYENIFTNITEVSFEGKPIHVEFYWSKYTPYSKMLVLTENDGGFIDAFSMQLVNSIEERFRSMTYLTLPFTGSFVNKLTGYTACFVAGGKVFGKGGYNIDEYSWWEVPAEGDYYVTDIGATVYNALIFFDEKNRRYIMMVGGYDADVSKLIEFSASDPVNAAFDPNDLQMDCIWMGSTSITSQWIDPTIAVLKDDTDMFYIQKFYRHYATGFNAELQLAMNAGSLDDNSVFANNPVQPFTYLSKGNVIHRFNRTTDAVEYDHLVVEADIKEMVVNHSGSVLGVVVDNGSGSKVIFYDLDNGNAILESYTTDSKVIDLKYKEDI